jgi:hypothetical protein
MNSTMQVHKVGGSEFHISLNLLTQTYLLVNRTFPSINMKLLSSDSKDGRTHDHTITILKHSDLQKQMWKDEDIFILNMYA